MNMSATTLCQYCQSPFKRCRNSNGMFCSLLCHSNYKRRLFIEDWLASSSHEKYASLIVSSYIRKYLFDIQGGCCKRCGLSDWMGCQIPLEIDHHDGNSLNNSPSNLSLLCATCHALTPTYKGKNRGAGRLSRSITVLSK